MKTKRLINNLKSYSIVDLEKHLKSRTAKDYTPFEIKKIKGSIKQQNKECKIMAKEIMKSGLGKLAIIEMTRRNENTTEIKQEGNKKIKYHILKADNENEEVIQMTKVLLIMQEIINFANITNKLEELTTEIKKIKKG